LYSNIKICFTGDKSNESALDNKIEPVQMIMASVDQGPNNEHIPDIDEGHEHVADNISEAQSALLALLGTVYFCDYNPPPEFVH
jgi:hypothetical protein